MRRIRGPRLCGALVILAVALVGCGGGDDGESTEPGSGEAIAIVEGVEGGEITQEDLDATIASSAELTGDEPPAPSSPDYPLVAGQALDGLILERWVEGEAAEQGVTSDQLQDRSVEGLEATWAPRTECFGDFVSRLCPGAEEPPADIPPASG